MIEYVVAFFLGYVVHLMTTAPSFKLFSGYCKTSFYFSGEKQSMYVPFDFRYKLCKVKYHRVLNGEKTKLDHIEGVPLTLTPRQLGCQQIIFEWTDGNDLQHFKVFENDEVPFVDLNQIFYEEMKQSKPEGKTSSDYVHKDVSSPQDQD
jgi:hypothetical protein